jgi:hypothetical protein
MKQTMSLRQYRGDGGREEHSEKLFADLLAG